MISAVIRCAFSAACVSACWSATVFAVVVAASAQRWWSIIATSGTGGLADHLVYPLSCADSSFAVIAILVLSNAGEIMA
jgi:hypothetical protein